MPCSVISAASFSAADGLASSSLAFSSMVGAATDVAVGVTAVGMAKVNAGVARRHRVRRHGLRAKRREHAALGTNLFFVERIAQVLDALKNRHTLRGLSSEEPTR